MKKQGATYGDIVRIGRINQEYLNGSFPKGAEKTTSLAWSVLDKLRQSIPEVRGGFGVGYPFHSVDTDNNLVPNPEFNRYNEEFIEQVLTAKGMAQTAIWNCSPCQQSAEFSPNHCASCTLVSLKPRDVMKAMPDIDMFVIAENIAAPTLANIQDVASQHGFDQSDFDVNDALNRIEKVLTAITTDAEPPSHLPSDIHVVQKSVILERLADIANGELDISLPIRSMYAGWKPNTDIDFWFDFIFSGTFNPELCDKTILQSARKARLGVVSIYTNQEIEDVVRSKSERAKVLLDYKPTRQLFFNKLDNWRQQ